MKNQARARLDPQAPRLAYADLYCGPGAYDDGTPSTPLLVMSYAAADDNLKRHMAFVFNDKNKRNIARLKNASASAVNRPPWRNTNQPETIAPLEHLAHPPTFASETVGPDVDQIVRKLEGIPTLSFLDPFGIKGLTNGLIRRMISGWGSDCIFFFNYRRINLSLKNPAYRQHIDQLFGAPRSERLREITSAIQMDLPEEQVEFRERIILEELSKAVQSVGGKYVFPFGFRNPSGRRLLHCLVLASKDFKAEKIWKDILSRESTDSADGIPIHQDRQVVQMSLSLGMPDLSISKLKSELATKFEGQILTFADVMLGHSPGRKYVTRNFKDAVLEMERDGLVSVLRASTRNKGSKTLSEYDRIQFKLQER